MLEPKPLPPAKIGLVFAPERDTRYVHFKDAALVPFEGESQAFSRRNAWWLADTALLSYWDPAGAEPRFARGGLSCRFFAGKDTQGYIAWPSSGGTFAIVSFRGTEPDRLRDILTDLGLAPKPWDVPGELVHLGFQQALDDVWAAVVDAPELAGRRVWFTGHSLGAALATLAGDRFGRAHPDRLGGIYTYGAPLVGNRAFVDGFNRRHGACSHRFVNDRDSVPTLPPPSFGYRHVNNERLVGFNDPDVIWLAEPLIDHAPVRYAVLAWNTLVEELQPV